MKRPRGYTRQVAEARQHLLALARAELAGREFDPVAAEEAAEQLFDEIEMVAERLREFNAADLSLSPAVLVAIKADRSPIEKIAAALNEGGWEQAADALAAHLASRAARPPVTSSGRGSVTR